MPVVQKRRWVSLPLIPSSRTLNPTYNTGGKIRDILHAVARNDKQNLSVLDWRSHCFPQFLHPLGGDPLRD